MSKMKRKKRLGFLAFVFLLVFLTGSAFAFVPGMLDVVGRVGLRETGYVEWVLAATQGSVERVVSYETGTDPAAPGTDRNMFTDDLLNDEQRDAAGDETISAVEPEVYLTHAQIVDERGRNNQRIEWSVVFQGAGVATLYVQAMNWSEVFDADITRARIVELTDFGPVGPFDTLDPAEWLEADRHDLPITSQTLNDIFDVGGTFDGLVGTLDANNADGTEPGSSTDIVTITIEWDGTIGNVVDAIDAEFWEWQDDVDLDGVITGGTWVNEATGVSDPDRFADAGALYMLVTENGVAVPLDELTPWIGTFVIEVEYEIAS